ncbi:MAG: cutinase family protein [bacterium]|nr:cutinase family protein [bacterium]
MENPPWSATRNASSPLREAPGSARRLLAGVLALLIAASGSGVGVSPAGADDVPVPPCSDLTVVFARGSDQELATNAGHGGMAQAFFDSVETRLPGYSINKYELGTEAHGGYRYRAVGISAILDLYRTNVIRVIVSLIRRISRQDASRPPSGSDLLEIDGLGALEYRNSVIEGIGEFTAYLEDRGTACPDEVFLVGGFSQGAQVIRRSMFLLGRATRDRIAHVALFSDPTLHLPEGESTESIENCRQGIVGTVSPWRRGTVRCSTSNGLLNLDGLTFLRIGPHTPYAPSDIESRIGSWCERTDGVCTGSVLDLILGVHFHVETRRFHVPIHGVYTDKYFEEAATEAVSDVVAPPVHRS